MPQDDLFPLKRRFAFYGFPECPLTDEQIRELLRTEDEDTIYAIGCDVYCGIEYADAVMANVTWAPEPEGIF